MESLPWVFVYGGTGSRNPNSQGFWAYKLCVGEEFFTAQGTFADKQKPIADNVAEFIATLKALVAYVEMGGERALILRSTSKMVINVMSGSWNGGKTQARYKDVAKVIRKFIADRGLQITWEWVSAEPYADVIQAYRGEAGL
jgi:ribonuclease HI